MPHTLDSKDLAILSELDFNARQSDAMISRKVGSYKQFVDYRMHRLAEAGIITGFYAQTDFARLGYSIFNVLLQFQGIREDVLSDIIRSLREIPNVGHCIRTIGAWDIYFAIFVRNTAELNAILTTVNGKYAKFIAKQSILINVENRSYPLKYLLRQNRPRYVDVYGPTGSAPAMSFDRRTKAVFEELRRNPRISIVELSNKTGLDAKTAFKKTKELIDKKVIVRFKAIVDVRSLGMERFLCMLDVDSSNAQKMEQFIKFTENHPNIVFMIRTFGSSNFILDVHAKSHSQFHQIFSELLEKFTDIIRNRETLLVSDEIKRKIG